MPIKKLFAFTFVLTGFVCSAQKFSMGRYEFSDSIVAQFEKDKFNQLAAWKLSYIGEYEAALKMWDKSEMQSQELPDSLKAYVKKFRPVNANEFIKQKAKTEQIIIVNEAHQQPQHRVFTRSILKDLYAAGFRYFGAETVMDMDKTLNQRKYPLLENGNYLQEPCYGELVREAMKIGFKIFEYESMSIADTVPGKREMMQAMNIKKILDKDPKAKILIHCGFDHLVETPVQAWGKAMAGRLQEYTGINPFTIDQVQMTEHSSPEFENSSYKTVSFDEFCFMVDSSGKVFNGQRTNKDYDARVYHPRTKYVNGRPNWVFSKEKTPAEVKQLIKISYPCIVMAYYANEKFEGKDALKKASPADVIELKSKDEQKMLALKPGNYKIVIRDTKGKWQTENLTVKKN